jgi:predicted nuclease of restriction endonuclease-like RecB superfamily
MRFAFGDLKKTILRRGGEPRVALYLLQSDELARELAALIALYESWLNRERGDFPADRPAELIGDYRLARCLEMCLGEWYEWQSPPWPGPASPELAAALAARSITSSSQLRLALFDFVNARHGGYLGEAERAQAIAEFAAELSIPDLILNFLLSLDRDAEAVLTRVAPAMPAPAWLAARYNQCAVESVLANAAVVEWVLPAEWSSDGGEGLGTAVKRICFLARRMGVHYDLVFGDLPSGDADGPDAPQELSRTSGGELDLSLVAEGRAAYGTSPTPLDSCGRPLVVSLFGPQEVMGAPNQYGERLARLCRALLGYRRADSIGRAALAGGGLRGTARVFLHGRPLLFALDDRLLQVLRASEVLQHTEGFSGGGDLEAASAGSATAAASGDAPNGGTALLAFDSSLEERLHAEFGALEAIGETHGWHLEREPAPLLAEGIILVPDFALTRGPRRVYLEIAGYWRPGYRARKARKLAALRGRVDFILVAPASSRTEFASVGAGIALLWYDDMVSMRDLLALLDRAYDDFDERLVALDTARVRRELAARGRIEPAEARSLLGCYTRGELAICMRMLGQGTDPNAPEWVEGVGICAREWLADVLALAQAEVALALEGRLPLAELKARLSAARPEVTALGEPAIETLALRASLHVRRVSIFEAEVELAERAPYLARSDATPAEPVRRAQPQRRPRRTIPGDTYITPPLFVPEGSSD